MTVPSKFPSNQHLDARRLRELLNYDPDTGLFRWRESRRGRAIPEATVGRLARNGYWEICVDYKRYRAHRLAWLHVFGVWPSGEIDHTASRPTTASATSEILTAPRTTRTFDINRVQPGREGFAYMYPAPTGDIPPGYP